MKRPEGFDAPGGAGHETRSAPEPRERRAREKKTRETSPARPVRGEAGAADPVERPARRRPERRERAARRGASDRSAARAAAAELREAERARRRSERAELKRFTRRTRRRRIAWLSGTGVVLALVALILVAVYSPLLALREIRVTGTNLLDAAQVEAAIDGQLGTPLALLDETRLEEELGQFTLIRSYTTELLPPGTLIVHVTERTPIGVIAGAGSFDVVDAAGVVLATTPERPPGVPVIRVADDEIDSAAFRSVAEVLMALPPELLAQVDAVTASTRDDVTLQLTGSNQRVAWGSAEQSDHKARVLAALLAIHGGAGPGVYDVSAPGTAVFRAG